MLFPGRTSACGVRNQLVDALYIPQHLDTCHLLPAPCDDVVGSDAADAAPSSRNASPTWRSLSSGTRITGALPDGRMFQQQALDLRGMAVEAADDEHVLLAPDDAQPAAIGELAQVAGVHHPTASMASAVGRRVVEVALHHAVAANQNRRDSDVDEWVTRTG
jgi:hypothetical protein